jgi:hypothetical protein
MTTTARPLHLRTQHNQPYGSERRCCEYCGAMVWGAMQGADTPRWTDDPAAWEGAADKCSLDQP